MPVAGQIVSYFVYQHVKEEELNYDDNLSRFGAGVLHYTPPSSAEDNHKELNHDSVDVPEDNEDLKNCVTVAGSDLEDSDEETD